MKKFEFSLQDNKGRLCCHLVGEEESSFQIYWFSSDGLSMLSLSYTQLKNTESVWKTTQIKVSCVLPK